MPNGRTGGFCHGLHQMLGECEANAVVGHVLERKKGIASKLRQVLAKWMDDEIEVEEQDHKFYIVQLSKWVTIDDRSPLFERFRQHHAEWLKEMARKIRGPD